MDITESLVQKLIQEQFPQWAHLPITPVAVSGWDNRTFHLGSQMSVRLPSGQYYAAKVLKEQTWLPFLAPHLSLAVPQPVAMGKPSTDYPWNWSIFQWINGTSANIIADDKLDLRGIAYTLAQFLHELHEIDTTNVPLLPGPHNGYRGDVPAIYDEETRHALEQLHGVVDTQVAAELWSTAMHSRWHKNPVWIHGDLSAGNIIIHHGVLTAVIDFGGMGIGDPACDLVIAWTLFCGESRTIFKLHVGLDDDTWNRARGWALWKALITLAPLKDAMNEQALRQKYIINELIKEYKTL